MDHDDYEYDIFECLPDGSVMWREGVTGLISARRKLTALVTANGSEYFALKSTGELIFPVAAPAIAKRVFQIVYTDKLRKERAELLRRRGYGVLSVMGNGAAKAILTALQIHPDGIAFFIVGHAAPQAMRKEMVDWLRSRYPKAKILVLNPPDQQTDGAGFQRATEWPGAVAALSGLLPPLLVS